MTRVYANTTSERDGPKLKTEATDGRPTETRTMNWRDSEQPISIIFVDEVPLQHS